MLWTNSLFFELPNETQAWIICHVMLWPAERRSALVTRLLAELGK